MEKNRWIISDVARKTGLEAHVLRYWEKELDLEIPRNELGHRYYLDCHIEIFNKIHNLKEQGYQLKAIKNAIYHNNLTNTNNIIPMPIPSITNNYRNQEENQIEVKNPNDKMNQFRQILSEVMLQTMNEHGKEMGIQISDKVIKQVDYLLRMQEELEDERFRRLDETIRSYQKDRQEIGLSYKENKRQNHLIKKKQKRVMGHA